MLDTELGLVVKKRDSFFIKIVRKIKSLFSKYNYQQFTDKCIDDEIDFGFSLEAGTTLDDNKRVNSLYEDVKSGKKDLQELSFSDSNKVEQLLEDKISMELFNLDIEEGKLKKLGEDIEKLKVGNEEFCQKITDDAEENSESIDDENE